jgi:hypothetical protein
MASYEDYLSLLSNGDARSVDRSLGPSAKTQDTADANFIDRYTAPPTPPLNITPSAADIARAGVPAQGQGRNRFADALARGDLIGPLLGGGQQAPAYMVPMAQNNWRPIAPPLPQPRPMLPQQRSFADFP